MGRSDNISKWITLGIIALVFGFGLACSGGEGNGDDGSTTYYIKGYVRTSNGTGISGATVSFSGGYSSVITDDSGYYHKSGLSSGTYTITPSKSDYTFNPPSRAVAVPPSHNDVDFTAEDVSVSDGSMSQISEYCVDTIAAIINAEPNEGPLGTPSTVTITFSNGGDLIQDIETYQCVEAGTFHATPQVDPEKESPGVWKASGFLSGLAGAVRYYGLAADGSPIAQGEIELNGGGIVPGYNEDEIYDHVWVFSEETDWGFPPPGWEDDSNVIPPAFEFGYRVTTFDGKSCLQIKTEGGTGDLFGVTTSWSSDYGATGRYQWRIYVPSMSTDSGAVRAFLKDDANDREIDFEIRYGTAGDRAGYEIPDGQLMCYMTVQQDDSSGTDESTDAIAVDPGSWYTLQIILTSNDYDQYVVSWKLKKQGDDSVWPGRSDYTCGYGPSNTSLHIECGVEDFVDPVEDIDAYFDYVFFTAR